jgi:hypothetical protein
MIDTDDSFVARTPDGRRVTARVKRDRPTRAEYEKICNNPDRGQALADMLKAFPNPKRCGQSFAESLAKIEADDNGDGTTDHPIDRLAGLLVAAGSFPDRAAALHFLLRRPAGVALVRTHKTEKDIPHMDRITELHDIMKHNGGPLALAKHICESGAHGISESEFTAAVTRHAQAAHPELSSDRAFAKIYESEIILRRACQVLKAAEFSVFDIKPVVITGADARDVENATAAVRAYEEIVRIGREKFPFLPANQQFARIFEDANYAALAAQAHRRPSATTSFPMPR